MNRVLVPKLLLISDQESTLPLWTSNLLQEHWQIVHERQPSEAFQRWIDEAPDMIVLDLQTPEALEFN